MRIVFFDIKPWMQEYVPAKFSAHEITLTSESLTEVNAAQYADAEVISIGVLSKPSEVIFARMPQLKLIAARSTGYDHIDLAAAKARGIVVTNVPQYGSVTVAEHTWALILALSRRIFESYDRTEAADFSTLDLQGFDLEGKTLGIIGLGAIGRHVARIAKGFGMKLRVLDPIKDAVFASQFDDFVFVDRVEDIYTHADVVSFHAPLTHSTYHMLNESNYRLLKPGCVVVNTSRGALIETQALVKALEEKIVRGAGLDVLEAEELMKVPPDLTTSFPAEHELAEVYLNHRLIGMNNVLITPHNAFNSDESIYRQVDENIASILSFIDKGNDCINQVK